MCKRTLLLTSLVLVLGLVGSAWATNYYVRPNGGSYGNEDGLWELGVTQDGSLTYDTPITDDVIGRLTEDEVQTTLAQIAALPPS